MTRPVYTVTQILPGPSDSHLVASLIEGQDKSKSVVITGGSKEFCLGYASALNNIERFNRTSRTIYTIHPNPSYKQAKEGKG